MRELTPLKIGYFADGIWAHNALKKLILSPYFEICFIVPRFNSTDTILENLALTYHIPYIKTQNINSHDFMEQIAPFCCDIFVSMSFNQIFKEPLISLPPLKTINCHAGKLPFYRGRNILNWALINDEKEFGISVHYIDSDIDTGDIILQRSYPISDLDDYSTLLHTAHIQCAEVLFDALMLLYNGTASPTPQDSIHQVGFYCPARCKGDKWIIWNQPSRDIFNFIRALNTPDLGALAQIKKQDEIINIRIFKSHLIENAPSYIATPGAIVGVIAHSKDMPTLIVKTQDSTLALTRYESSYTPRLGDRFLNTQQLAGGGGSNTLSPLLFPSFSLPHIFLYPASSFHKEFLCKT